MENIQILNAALEGEQEVLFALDGARALEMARTQRPDLILLDAVMPGMDGYAVCAALRGSATPFPRWRCRVGAAGEGAPCPRVTCASGITADIMPVSAWAGAAHPTITHAPPSPARPAGDRPNSPIPSTMHTCSPRWLVATHFDQTRPRSGLELDARTLVVR